MGFFDQIAAENAPKPEQAEVKIDLGGMQKPEALQKLDQIVKYCKLSATASLFITFDPARPGQGETLFQPIARYFKIEKLNGYILSAVPVMTTEQGGLFVKFKTR